MFSRLGYRLGMADEEPTPADVQQVLASSLDRFAGWTLTVGCPKCWMLRLIRVNHVLARTGAGATVSQVVARLRCQDCGSPPYWVNLANHARGTASGRVLAFMLLDETERIRSAREP